MKLYYLNNLIDIFKIWQGGMSFHGALVGIIIASYYFAKKNNDNIFEYLDIIALVSPIGIFFGSSSFFIKFINSIITKYIILNYFNKRLK